MKLTPVMKSAIEYMLRHGSMVVDSAGKAQGVLHVRTARSLMKAKICDVFGSNEFGPGSPTTHLFLLKCVHCAAKGIEMAEVSAGADAICPKCKADGKTLKKI